MKKRARPRQKSQKTESALSFRRRKLTVCLWIMGVGMLIAILWHGSQWLAFGNSYPYNTLLFLPSVRFSDYTDPLTTSLLPNPYFAPDTPYPPFTWVVLRPITHASTDVSFIFFLFISLGGMAMFLSQALASIVQNSWARVGITYFLLGCSYPLLFCIDRGNIELFVAFLVSGALYFIGRARYLVAMLWLVPAICFKLYPALLLFLLARQLKFPMALAAGGAFVIITLTSLSILSLSPQNVWDLYQRNMAYFFNFYVYENHSLEGSAFFWNCIKVGLISAAQVGMIAPVDFSYDGTFVHQAFAIYSAGMFLLVVILVLFAGILEKEFLRSAMLLLLFFAVGSPPGGDYRLIYAGMALLILVLAKSRRKYDWLILILLASTMVAKKEVFLNFVGKTESSFDDVSIQVVLNPLFVGAAIVLLLLDSWRHRDMPWIRLRLNRWKNAFIRIVHFRQRSLA